MTSYIPWGSCLLVFLQAFRCYTKIYNPLPFSSTLFHPLVSLSKHSLFIWLKNFALNKFVKIIFKYCINNLFNVSFEYETFLPMFAMESYVGLQDGDHVDFTVVAVDAKYKRSEPATYTIVIENRNEKLYDEIINNIQVFESILIWQTDTVGSRGLKSAQIHSIRIDGNNLYIDFRGC